MIIADRDDFICRAVFSFPSQRAFLIIIGRMRLRTIAVSASEFRSSVAASDFATLADASRFKTVSARKTELATKASATEMFSEVIDGQK